MRKYREKMVGNVVKTTGKTLRKMCEKVCEKCSAGTAGRTNFECEKITEFFTIFWPVCLQPFVGGVRFVAGAHFRGIVSTDAGVCIRPSLASRFPG